MSVADSSLMPVVVGGAIGIAGTLIGSFVGPLILEWRKQAAERKKKKADKLEELLSVLYDHEHWVAGLSNNLQLGTNDVITVLGKLPPPPISKMLTISNIYFPEFQEPIQQFSKVAADHVRSILQKKDQAHFAESNELFAQHSEAVKHLEQLIRDYSKRELQ